MVEIKHYTTSTKGIGGLIKKRISDFIVREITLDGKTLATKSFNENNEIKQEPIEIPELESEKEYLQLTMEKFNLDTTEATRRIGRILRISPKRIGYAGLKDRRAITSQKISIWKPDINRLKNFKARYITLTEPEWKDKPIQIGDLQGNEFEITIRNIEMSEKELSETTKKCFAEMETKGVANYFGEQRFGGIRKVTHLVGKELIKGNFEKAIMTYLTHSSEEEKEILEARKNLAETKDFKKGLREFPKKFRYERAIMHHLANHPHDFVGAFQKMPKHLIYLFTHAYQSYLFNMAINERIESGLGLEPIDGDIIIEEKYAAGPLFGFDLKLANGKAGEIEKKILEKEQIKLEDFKVKSFMQVSCSGARKKMLIYPKQTKILEITKDELNQEKLKMKISFKLEKGGYATTILRELMKND